MIPGGISFKKVSKSFAENAVPVGLLGLHKNIILVYGIVCTLYGVLTVFMTEMMEATLGALLGTG